jgi:hypothetical protein
MNLFRTLLFVLSVLFMVSVKAATTTSTTTTIPNLSFSGNIYLPRSNVKLGSGSFALSSTGAFTAQATLLGRTYRAAGKVAQDLSFTATLTGRLGPFTLKVPVKGKLSQDAQGWLLTGTLTVGGKAYPFSLRPPPGTLVGV